MAIDKRRQRLLIAVTSPETAKILMRGQLGWLQASGFDVSVLSGGGPDLRAVGIREGVGVYEVPMKRDISLLSDIVALIRLVGAIRQIQPELSVVSTPKAGLLAGIAAVVGRVPSRIYMLRGLRLEGARGIRRVVLWVSEGVACACAHEVLAVSPSLLEEARRLRLVSGRKIAVLGSGSSNGVAVTQFDRTPVRELEAREFRRQMGLGSAKVIGFVGRFSGDKGLVELVTAFRQLRARLPELRLLLVGAYDPTDPVDADIRLQIRSDSAIVTTGWLSDPASAYHCMDVFVLPSKREGFPNVALEAAAAGLPVISTTATGARDAVRPFRTGLLVEPGDVEALEGAIEWVLRNPQEASQMGRAGRRWVEENFQREAVWSRYGDHYHSVIDARTIRT